MLYFDHNATTPMIPEAREVWLDATDRFIGNPSSLHRVGERADKALELAREELAGMLGCHPLDIVWTSGATESCNMVLRQFADDPICVAWVSAIEHPCVEVTGRKLYPKRCRFMPVTDQGVLDLDRLREELSRRRPGFMGCMAANNETGVIQPWREVLELANENKVPFFCDATQWLGRRPAAGLCECAFVAGSAHKFGGPRGVGFLKCPSGTTTALITGGAQEQGRRAGTENVPGILAMIKALSVREAQLKEGRDAERFQVRESFINKLLEGLPGCQLLGADVERLWNTVTVLMPKSECPHRWVVKLDKAGFAVSSGSACASGKEDPSHVLMAMGIDPDDCGRALRFSGSWETTSEEWDQLLGGILDVHAALLAE